MISPDVEYWIKCVDTFNLLNKIDGRPVLIWGAYSKAGILCDAVRDMGIEVAGYIDGHKDICEYRKRKVYKPYVLAEKKYYIIIAIEGIRSEIKAHLGKYGYIKDKDYFYFSEHTPDIKLSGLMGEYCDVYNNRFIYEGDGSIDINIHCIGGGNTVIIGKDFGGDLGLKILLSYGGAIKLGDNFISHGDVTIDATMGGCIVAGKGFSLMTNTNINAKYCAEIEIGDYVTSGERLFMTAGRQSKVLVGNDCMLSHDVSLHGTNGHSILDMNKCENHSSKTEKPIEIGNHVWLGKGCSVLYGTEVGDGSIVGTQSILKGVYPAHCIVAGNIAKVVRENCTWDRRREIEFDEL